MRDAAINAYGVLSDDTEEEILAEPASAGLGAAAMINEAPEESIALYLLVRRLGETDMKAGIARLLELGNADGGRRKSAAAPAR